MPRAAHSFLEAQVLAEACDAFERSTGIYRAAPARKHVSYSDASISFDLAGRKFEMPTLVTTRLGLAEMANTLLAESRSSVMEPHPLYRRLMLVAPYIEPQLADRLIKQNVPFLDAAGNVFLSEPEGMVMISGRPKPQQLQKPQTGRATTRKGLQVMFAIATQPGLVSEPYRTIAQAAGVALSTVNQVIDDLQFRGLLAQKTSGERIFPDWQKFVFEWSSLYQTRLRLKLGARRFASTTPDWWREFDFASVDARLGGESAADILTNELKAANVTLYSRAPLGNQFMLNARLRPDPRGDVEILESFWPQSLELNWMESGRQPLVHPFLIYADLVASGDSRNLSVAAQIYEQYLPQP
ncbi:type IV toxin-antitoxin system AbiEi family antitoxin [Paraburkholderia sp. BL6665CI2N2]|uniref:type IV toxin-antitoxin system AbiEi family antitoxin n=1 Tax=Paraburkholderia sp. BL6665CI2N2 TaxID=1938806 RepID=UPI001066409A|nr:type IV toxin-antitoxin system AbiEi family antitoxin [Paraburkholderia sp. BL6665CI2N2]